MLASFIYLALRKLIELVLLRPRSRQFKELEIVVLRHELAILRRQVGRPQLQPADRGFLATASRLLPRAHWNSFLVAPETLLRWHRRLVALDLPEPSTRSASDRRRDPSARASPGAREPALGLSADRGRAHRARDPDLGDDGAKAATRQLERVLRVYVDHYNGHRPHRALGLATLGRGRPALRLLTPPAGPTVRRQDRLGGLIHEYRLAA